MAAKHFKLREDGEIRYVRVGLKQNNGGNGQEGKMTGGFRLIYMFVYMCECVKLDVIPIVRLLEEINILSNLTCKTVLSCLYKYGSMHIYIIHNQIERE